MFEQLVRDATVSWNEFSATGTPRMLVGTGTCGCAAGARDVMAKAGDWFASHGVPARIHEVGCLGLCYAEPLVELTRKDGQRVLYGDVHADVIEGLLQRFYEEDDLCHDLAVAVMQDNAVEGIPPFHEHPMLAGQVRVALRNCGLIDPANTDHYLANEGYAGLARALGMTPEAVVQDVRDSGLRGRGGAGFPTGVKWDLCRQAPGNTKYMICNADEGDPGAFMDRSVLESDPHAVIEGMAIAAYAIGASAGYIYIRAEYPLAIERLVTAIEQAEARGLLGTQIMASSFAFTIKIKKGAGAFVCGEETALLASIEGRRGMPRTRPPFPAQAGLHGKPTNINNVETLANIPMILAQGSAAYAREGTEKSRGTKTFALTGKVERTGLIEVPLGTPLRQIVFDIGGGIPDGRQLKAVQTGGPSGGCIPAELLDLPVDYEHLAEAGAIMGSGGMIVMDEDICMVDIARYFIDFTQDESCGKCAPCRLGTKQMLQILEDLTRGEGKPDDVALLEELGHSIKLGSLCGLGQTAPNPILSTIRYFRDEYTQHLDGACPARQCRALITYDIEDTCIGCAKCARHCPADAILSRPREQHLIDQHRCIRCDLCRQVCPVDAVTVLPGRLGDDTAPVAIQITAEPEGASGDE